MEEPDSGKVVGSDALAVSSQPKTSNTLSKEPVSAELLPASSISDTELVEVEVHLNKVSLETVSSNGVAESSQAKSLSVNSKAELNTKDGILDGEEAELDYDEDEGEIIESEVAGDGKGMALEDGELEEGELEEEGEEGEILSDSDQKVL